MTCTISDRTDGFEHVRCLKYPFRHYGRLVFMKKVFSHAVTCNMTSHDNMTCDILCHEMSMTVDSFQLGNLVKVNLNQKSKFEFFYRPKV